MNGLAGGWCGSAVRVDARVRLLRLALWQVCALAMLAMLVLA